MFHNIAVAYDGSDGSRMAFNQAIEMKKALPDVKLSVIYVNEEYNENFRAARMRDASAPVVLPQVDSTYAQYMPPEIGENNHRAPNDLQAPTEFEHSAIEYSKHMHNAIQQQLDEKGVEADVLALEGSASKTIAAFIEEQNIDLLVVGNSGKSGLQRFFVGSVSKRLLKESSCSVLVVK